MNTRAVSAMRRSFAALLTAMLIALSVPVLARDRVYLAPEEFITAALPATHWLRVLWLTKDMEDEIARILGHPPIQLRQRYWTDGVRTAWILEEIGKENLITAGFLVQGGRIEQARVLVYRESRGMEVRHPAFVNQFSGAALAKGNRLDRPIDGISGATLSVGAMERMVRAALYFDRKAQEK